MKEQNLVRLIYKSFSGQITTKELKQLEKYREQPKYQLIYDELSSIWEMTFSNKPVTSEEMQLKSKYVMEGRIKEINRQKEKEVSVKKKNTTIILGLSVIIMFLLTILVYPVELSKNSPTIYTSFSSEDQINSLLPDSTLVYLKKHSTLNFQQTSEARNIALTGEALFKVHENKQKPFIIEAGTATIRVTGTSFVIKCLPGEVTQVLLISGKVEVSYEQQKIELSKENDLAIIDQGIIKTVNEDKNFYSWHTGIYSFEDVPILDILKKLEQDFQVTIETGQDSFLKKRFSGKFENGEDLPTILNVLAHTANFSFKLTDHVYHIKGPIETKKQ